MATKETELEALIKTDISPPDGNKDIVEKALTQMNFSEAAKQLLLDPKASDSDLDSLKSIALTQEHLTQVKKSLGAIVDSLHENPSLISRAAAFWGKLPLWQRIIGGVAISAPTLVIGAAAHIGFLVTVSGVSALAYTTSSIVLDDHHFHTQSIAEKLKEGIFGVAEVLELTISALDSIRKKLAMEVERFKSENEKLSNTIIHLNDEIEKLSRQVEVLVATANLLQNAKEALETTAVSLKKDLEHQSEAFEANQKEMELIKVAHEKSLVQLAEKVSELSLVRTSMRAEVDKAKQVASTLEGAVKTLSGAVISDSSQRLAFQDKLTSFLSDKTSSFDQVADRICKAETELAQVKSELQVSNDRYKKLLELQEMQIDRLEHLDIRVDTSVHPKVYPTPAKTKGLLSSFGLMSFPTLWPVSTPTPPISNTPKSVGP